MQDWNEHLKRLLKSEMAKKGVKNAELADRLSQLGIDINTTSLSNKISRGTFSATFFMQCLYVLGCHNLEIISPYKTNSERDEFYKNLYKK